jgi:mitochondrial fission protein ELM1
MVIWRIVDGRRGHDNQSRGLVNALSRHVSCVCHDISVTNTRTGLWHLLLGKYPAGDSLPGPQLIIGAGHATHIHLLCARRAHGGRTVVIMKPGLPAALFDFCLIPDHDNPGISDSSIITRGALNAITPGKHHDPARGLIMIGGPSRHYDWDDNSLLDQVSRILGKAHDIQWVITDSPRTPDSTSILLNKIMRPNTVFRPHKDTGPDWVSAQLQNSGYVWVSEDSMSMIYESMTAGAATGVLSVPARKKSKIYHSINRLADNEMVTRFSDWVSGKPLSVCPEPFDEADRCARELLDKITQHYHVH